MIPTVIILLILFSGLMFALKTLKLIHQTYHKTILRRNPELQKKYEISQFGFLPEGNCSKLPQNWGYLVDVRDNITNNNISQFRSIVENLPQFLQQDFPLTQLSVPEKRFLFVLLTTAASKYIRGDPNDVRTVVPQGIGLPLYLISQSLGVQPYMSYYSAVNWNILSRDPTKPVSLDNTDIIVSYSVENHRDVKNFLVQHAMIEQLGGECLPYLLSMHDCMEKRDNHNLKEILKITSESLNNITQILTDFHNHVGKDEFFAFRKFFVGTEDKTLFPNGITLQGVPNMTFTWGNANGGQSGLLQVFDRLVSPPHSDSSKRFLTSNLITLPKAHQDFIFLFENGPSLHTYVEDSHDEDLKAAFEGIKKGLLEFRMKHLCLASRYIPEPYISEPRKLLDELIQSTSRRIVLFKRTWKCLWHTHRE